MAKSPLPVVERELAKAQVKPYEELRAAHVKDLPGASEPRRTLNVGVHRSGGRWHCRPTKRLKRYSGVAVHTLLCMGTALTRPPATI